MFLMLGGKLDERVVFCGEQSDICCSLMGIPLTPLDSFYTLFFYFSFNLFTC